MIHKNNKYMTRLASYIFIIENNKLLMMIRENSGYEDGKYTVPSGHVESDETITNSIIRETHEEVDIHVDINSLKLLCVSQRKDFKYYDYIDFFFICNEYCGTPKNNEPHKCSDVRWFDLDYLPQSSNIVMEVDYVINNVLNKRHELNTLLPLYIEVDPKVGLKWKL